VHCALLLLLVLAGASLAACSSLTGRVKDEPITDTEDSAIQESAARPAPASAGAPADGKAASAAGGSGMGGAARPASGTSAPSSVQAAPANSSKLGAASVVAATPAPGQAGVNAGVDPSLVRSFESAVDALHAGHNQEAEREFSTLARAHPELCGAHANLGILYRRADRLEPAISELETAVHCNPQQAAAWNELGIAYRLQGHFDKAREAYERSMALDPTYPAPKLNLAILFDLYLWDGERALALYDQYLAQSPGGDAQVTKWIADLKNRNRAAGQRKDQP
jgi:Flp pilus assembly protein TadD